MTPKYIDIKRPTACIVNAHCPFTNAPLVVAERTPVPRELKAFVFVYEPAHRIVVEWCVYGTAAYVFEVEEPLPVEMQVWEEVVYDNLVVMMMMERPM